MIPSKEDILHAMHEERAESYLIYAEKIQVGGCILLIDKNSNCNILDFLFINKGMEGKNLGVKIWHAIENKYPQTKRWMTITPHFEVRNIHFYINKCQFKAVEFAHPHYLSSTRPIHPILKDEYYFYFEKEMQIYCISFSLFSIIG